MTGTNDERLTVQRREAVLSGATILLFSVSQGMATVLVPLLATAAGYSLGAIGFLIGASAVTQIIARAGMGAMLDHFSTRAFILAALVFMAASNAVLSVSDTLWVFIVSQLLQGAGRAYFFTGTQIHVVRGSRPATAALTFMNVINGIGLLIGPIVAGLIGDWSLQFALLIGAAIAAVALPACTFLIRYEPFVKPRVSAGEKVVPVWRRSGVITAGWMGATAGSWRATLNSYLPVLVTLAGHSVPIAGAMTTLANLAALAGSALSTPSRRIGLRFSIVAGTVLAAGGVAVMVFVMTDLLAAGAFLALSGLGAGLLQTLGPALGAEVVAPEERGRSIATIGTFRAVSLLVTPMGIGALVFVLPTAAMATALVSIAIAIPALWGSRSVSKIEDASGS